MSRIRELLDIAARRVRMQQTSALTVNVQTSELNRARILLMEDGIDMTSFINAVIREYNSRNPWVVGVADGCRKSDQEKPAAKVNVASIYDRIGQDVPV